MLALGTARLSDLARWTGLAITRIAAARHGKEKERGVLFALGIAELPQTYGPPRDRHTSPETICYRRERDRAVRDAMAALPRRNAAVLRMRFWEQLTLEEIGLRLDISRERVRQLEVRALWYGRTLSLAKLLRARGVCDAE